MLCQHEGKWVLKNDRGHIIRAAHRHEIPADAPVEFTAEFTANYGSRLQQKYLGHLEKARTCKAILDQLKMPVDTFEGDLTEAEEEKILIELRDSMRGLTQEVRDLRAYVTPPANYVSSLSELKQSYDRQLGVLASQISVTPTIEPTDIGPILASLAALKETHEAAFERLEALGAEKPGFWTRLWRKFFN